MKQFNNLTIKLQGFTLIELLVTVGILAIMSGLAVFSFTSSNPERLLNLTAENIIGQLQQAQSLAFTGAKQGVIAPNGYGVFIDYASKQYKVYADTSVVGVNANHYDAGDTELGEIYDISNQLTLTTKDNTNTIPNNDNKNIDIFFSIPNAYLSIIADTLSSQSVDITLTVTAGQSKIIKIRTDSNSFALE